MNDNPYQADAQTQGDPPSRELPVPRAGGIVLVIGWSVVAIMLAIGAVEIASWLLDRAP